ncbi:MAG: hypothetical protein AB7F37_13640 [Variibacter sp.]
MIVGALIVADAVVFHGEYRERGTNLAWRAADVIGSEIGYLVRRIAQ